MYFNLKIGELKSISKMFKHSTHILTQQDSAGFDSRHTAIKVRWQNTSTQYAQWKAKELSDKTRNEVNNPMQTDKIERIIFMGIISFEGPNSISFVAFYILFPHPPVPLLSENSLRKAIWDSLEQIHA